MFTVGCDHPELSDTAIMWDFHEKEQRVFEVDGWLGDLGKGGCSRSSRAAVSLWQQMPALGCACGTEGSS